MALGGRAAPNRRALVVGQDLDHTGLGPAKGGRDHGRRRGDIAQTTKHRLAARRQHGVHRIGIAGVEERRLNPGHLERPGHSGKKQRLQDLGSPKAAGPRDHLPPRARRGGQVAGRLNRGRLGDDRRAANREGFGNGCRRFPTHGQGEYPHRTAEKRRPGVAREAEPVHAFAVTPTDGHGDRLGGGHGQGEDDLLGEQAGPGHQHVAGLVGHVSSLAILFLAAKIGSYDRLVMRPALDDDASWSKLGNGERTIWASEGYRGTGLFQR